MTVSGCAAFLFSFGAAAMDLRAERVDNRWIVLGWAAGAAIQTAGHGAYGPALFFAGAALPLALLWFLFLFRMMGAGDLKILSVAGGLLGWRAALSCIFWSFVLGAVMSAVIMAMENSFYRRFRRFFRYVFRYLRSRQRVPYPSGPAASEEIHFTVPILLGVILTVGGAAG